MRRFFMVLAVGLLMPSGYAYAQKATLTGLSAAFFEADSIAAREDAEAKIAALVETDNGARFLMGLTEMAKTLEFAGQSMTRHGYQLQTADLASMLPPMMFMTGDPLATPEPLDYETFREILVEIDDRLSGVIAILRGVEPDDEFGLILSMNEAKLNFSGDDNFAEKLPLLQILNMMSGRSTNAGDIPEISFRLDNADAIWLEGYAHLMRAGLNFWLAHDFEVTFNSSFHIIFPASDLPMQDVLAQRPGEDPVQWSSMADAVSLFHTINWPVVEPDRRVATLTELTTVMRLSRENWAAILAETDNDREWLPGPHQPGRNPITGGEVTQETLDGWFSFLDMTEKLLAGDLLLAHWRLPGRGVNLHRFFTEPTDFDLVLSLTGPGILPYLEEGPTIDRAQMRVFNDAMGRGGLGFFAFWFN